MRRAEAEVPLVAIFEPEQLLAVKVPAAGFLPQLGGGRDRHQHFLRARPVQLFADDLFYFADDPKTQR